MERSSARKYVRTKKGIGKNRERTSGEGGRGKESGVANKGEGNIARGAIGQLKNCKIQRELQK